MAKTKQSRTEKLLLAELYNLGLRPKPQHKISRMTVDFAFVDEKIVIEVDGIYHHTQKQKEADGNRDDHLQSIGWKVRRLSAEEVHKDPENSAIKVKNFIERNKPKKIIKKPKLEKKYTCKICGRKKTNKGNGNCWPCNARLKREREEGKKEPKTKPTEVKTKSKEIYITRNRIAYFFIGVIIILVIIELYSSFSSINNSIKEMEDVTQRTDSNLRQIKRCDGVCSQFCENMESTVRTSIDSGHKEDKNGKYFICSCYCENDESTSKRFGITVFP